MTSERVDEPTPAGGEYSIAVFMDLDAFVEVDEDAANGMIVTEYNGDGSIIMETVMPFAPNV